MRLALAFTLLVACRPAPTQTWVFVHLDPAFETDADALQVVITSRGEEVISRTDTIDRAREVVANLFLVPEGGDATRTWEIHATLRREDATLATLRVGGGYSAGEVRVVHAHFDTHASCLALGDCGPGRTCQSGRCVGACFESVTEDAAGNDARQLASCGECGRCTDGVCEPLAEGARCGCSGDACRGGECDPRVDVHDVWLGLGHACAYTNDGLWCWGSARTAQTTFREDTDRPRRVEATDTTGIVDMALGSEFSCAAWIRSGPTHGRSCWGWAMAGSFAMGELSGTQPPLEVEETGDTLVDIEAGRFFQCGLRESGLVQCAGNNDSNQLAQPDSVAGSDDWVDIPGRYDALSLGGSAACGTNDEGVWCWGLSTFDASVRSAELTCVPGAEGTCAMLSNARTSDGKGCALDAEGRAYCWGNNRAGLLGVEGPDRVDAASPVDSELRFSQLDVDSSICGIAYDGGLHCWGGGSQGQLGTGDSRNRPRPTRIEIDAADRWTDVAIGTGFGCAIRDDRQLYCWGANGGDGPRGSQFAGRLGLGLGTDGRDPAARASSRPMRVCFEDPPE